MESKDIIDDKLDRTSDRNFKSNNHYMSIEQ